jgi:hypothetical protein
MSKAQIKASDLVQDVRMGLDDDELMKKYELSSTQLASVFTRLVEAKRVTQAELDTRCLLEIEPLHAGISPNSDQGELVSMSETKRCPFCAEEIQCAAIKCKHCGEWFSNSPPEVADGPQVTIAPTPEKVPQPETLMVSQKEGKVVPDNVPRKQSRVEKTQNTQEAVSREWDIFVVGVLLFIIVAFILLMAGVPKLAIGGLSVIVFLFLVLRASLFLKQPLWLTILYCFAVIIQLGVIIVVVALIVQLQGALKDAEASVPGCEPM